MNLVIIVELARIVVSARSSIDTAMHLNQREITTRRYTFASPLP